jgi:hypothetical protein
MLLRIRDPKIQVFSRSAWNISTIIQSEINIPKRLWVLQKHVWKRFAKKSGDMHYISSIH